MNVEPPSATSSSAGSGAPPSQRKERGAIAAQQPDRPAKRAAVENRNVTKPARSVERAKSSNSTAGIGNRSPQKKTKRYLRFWTV
ncbi:hypothetical protein HYQ46_002135 [Verticillium longisporum]|nr:hypothetical protein HYQ46_002135 [Verticillium longisporum]